MLRIPNSTPPPPWDSLYIHCFFSDKSNSHIFSKELYLFEVLGDSTDVYNVVEETTMSEQ